MTLTFAQHVALAIIASGREITQSDLDRALRMGRWVADGMDAEGLVEALRSIAANTCCEPCQEATLVARAALAEYEARG